MQLTILSHKLNPKYNQRNRNNLTAQMRKLRKASDHSKVVHVLIRSKAGCSGSESGFFWDTSSYCLIPLDLRAYFQEELVSSTVFAQLYHSNLISPQTTAWPQRPHTFLFVTVITWIIFKVYFSYLFIHSWLLFWLSTWLSFTLLRTD